MHPSPARVDVDVPCPCCRAHPVAQTYQGRTLVVLFCTSCEHAWTVTRLSLHRREARPSAALDSVVQRKIS